MGSISHKTTLPISEVRRRIFEITNAVQAPGSAYAMTENGRPKAVIVSADEFESLVETLEILHEYPDILRDVEKARKEYLAGDSVTLEELKRGLLQPTYVRGPRDKKRAKKSRTASRKAASASRKSA